MIAVEKRVVAGMPYEVRPIEPGSDAVIDAVVRMTMETVLTTIPEFEGSAKKAQATFANFTFPAMREMIVADFPKPTHGAAVAEATGGGVVGHVLFSRKIDPIGDLYGYIFSMWVEPEHRRRGVGTALLSAAVDALQTGYVRAETHASNEAFRQLARSLGFSVAERKQVHWPVNVMILAEPSPSAPPAGGGACSRDSV